MKETNLSKNVSSIMLLLLGVQYHNAKCLACATYIVHIKYPTPRGYNMCNNKAESPWHHHTWSFCCGTFFQYKDNQFNYVCTWSWQPIFLRHNFQPVQLLSLQAQGNSHFLSHFEILPCPKVMISFSNGATSRHKAKR